MLGRGAEAVEGDRLADVVAANDQRLALRRDSSQERIEAVAACGRRASAKRRDAERRGHTKHGSAGQHGPQNYMICLRIANSQVPQGREKLKWNTCRFAD